MTRFEKFALAMLLATRNRGNGAIVLLPFFLVVLGSSGWWGRRDNCW
jgi:hypothetical protein